jgi:hypothetical protein
MAILVVGKCSANFGCQVIGKVLAFPGKRLQKSLPECLFTLDIRIFIGLGRKQTSYDNVPH